MKHLFLSSIVLMANIFAQAQTPIINTFAGNGTGAYSGDSGLAINATLSLPAGIATDRFGNVYIADEFNNVIRKVNTSGIITTIAGDDTAGYRGDGGPATAAQFNHPVFLKFDKHENLYISDFGNNVVRKIDTLGIITTIAGNDTAGYTGDSGLAVNAEINGPVGIAIDTTGNIFISDFNNNVIRKIDRAGVIGTVAGNGYGGYSGDGGRADTAELYSPFGIIFDDTGNLYIADYSNDVVRKVNTHGIITTFAGCITHAGLYYGDGGLADTAGLFNPTGLAFDDTGNLLISDCSDNGVRKVNSAGFITSLASNWVLGTSGGGYAGDGGIPANAKLSYPNGLAIAASGKIYIADQGNNRIRVIEKNHIPEFTSATHSFSLCENDSFMVNSLTTINDSDNNQVETWSVSHAPAHGAMSGFNLSRSSGDTIITPLIYSSYVPAPGYAGLDSFGIQISDGVDSTIGEFHVLVNPLPRAGFITGLDTVCPGSVITLTDAATGGVWSSSNTCAAVAAGEVIGITPGVDRIQYSVINSCGGVSVGHTVTVSALCEEAVVPLEEPASAFEVYPNPTTGDFNVAIKMPAKQVNVSLIDMYGKFIEIKNNATKANGNIITFSSRGLPTGIYLVRINMEENIYYEKLVVLGY